MRRSAVSRDPRFVLGAAGLVAGAAPDAQAHDRETIARRRCCTARSACSRSGHRSVPPPGCTRVLYHVVPLFTFLRAPSRFGLLRRGAVPGRVRGVRAPAPARRTCGARAWAAGGVAIAVAGDRRTERRAVPLGARAAGLRPATRCWPRMPRAPLAEFPFYGERIAFPLHAQYMVLSTSPLDAARQRLQRLHSAGFPRGRPSSRLVSVERHVRRARRSTASATSPCTGTCMGRAPRRSARGCKPFAGICGCSASDADDDAVRDRVVSVTGSWAAG